MRPTDKVYWSKVLLAAVVGAACAFLGLHRPSPVVGILFSVVMYVFFSRYSAALFRFRYEDFGGPRKVYTFGVGGYFLTWFVAWVLFYTLLYPPLVSGA